MTCSFVIIFLIATLSEDHERSGEAIARGRTCNVLRSRQRKEDKREVEYRFEILQRKKLGESDRSERNATDQLSGRSMSNSSAIPWFV